LCSFCSFVIHSFICSFVYFFRVFSDRLFTHSRTFPADWLADCRWTFRATDPDAGTNGDVSYSLSERSAARYGHLFAVDSRTGVVSQLRPVDFERHGGRDPVSLLVVSRDGGDAGSSLAATARVVVAVRDLNEHAPDVRFEATGSDVTGSGGNDGAIGSGGSGGATGSDVTGSGGTTGSGGSGGANGSDVSAASAAASVLEHGGPGEFVAHMTVSDRDSGDAGRVHCTLPSRHFTLVRLHADDYKVSHQHQLQL